MYETVRTPDSLVDDELPSPQVRWAQRIVDLEHEKEALKQRIADMQHDWDLLNTYLNTTAVSFRWCSTYEHRMFVYNSNFKVLQIVPRRPDEVGRERDPYDLICPTCMKRMPSRPDHQ